MLRKLLVLSPAFLILLIGGLVFNSASAGAPPPFDGIFPPVTVSSVAQIISGGKLIIPNALTAGRVFATRGLGVGLGLIGNDVTNPSFNPTVARLDVNGQIRIRCGGTEVITINKNDSRLAKWKWPLLAFAQSDFCQSPSPGQILTAANDTGLTNWATTAGIAEINQGVGISLNPNPIVPSTTDGEISIDPAVTQKRVTGTCDPFGAIAEINEDGSVVCRNFVTTLQTLGGLTGAAAPASGLLALNINVGGGLYLTPALGRLAVNPPVPSSSGLVITLGNYLKFDASSCDSTKNYWEWTSALGWRCRFYEWAHGGGVLYIKTPSGGTLANCPAGWTKPSSAPWYFEKTGNTYNLVRACLAPSGQRCQVMYLKSSVLTVPELPLCPSDWTVGIDPFSGTYFREYVLASSVSNYTRPCVRCK